MLTWLRDPNGAGMWICLTVIALLISVLLASKQACGDPPGESTVDQPERFADADDVEEYVRWWLGGVRQGKRWDRARELAEAIVKYSSGIDPVLDRGEYVTPNDIDPLKVAINLVYESSLRINSKGSVGELGLPQIHPLNTRALYRSNGTRYDMTKLEDSVEAGARWLGYCEFKCETLEAAYSSYKTGSCKIVDAGKFRAGQYRKARVRLGLVPVS